MAEVIDATFDIRLKDCDFHLAQSLHLLFWLVLRESSSHVVSCPMNGSTMWKGIDVSGQ